MVNMNKIYNITRGQLITVWIFGAIGWIYYATNGFDSYYRSPSFVPILIWIVPFILVFYTIGWKNYRKNESK